MAAGTRIGRLAAEQVARADQGLDRHRQRVIVGARSQLGRHSERLAHRTQALRGSAKGGVEGHRHRLEAARALLARSAVRSLASEEVAVATRAERLAGLPDRRLEAEGMRTAQWRRLLSAYDFQRQLDRGYSVTRDASGRVVRSAATLSTGARLSTRLAEGSATSEVVETAMDAPDPDDGDQGDGAPGSGSRGAAARGGTMTGGTS